MDGRRRGGEHGRVHESSERLMTLLRGGRVDKPPFWEPWFCMTRMLQRRYGGSYLALAQDLDHAAVPIPSPDTNNLFLAPVSRIESTGVYYGGGELREPEQLELRREPDYGPQLGPMLEARRRCAEAGRACWVVLGWCFDRIAASMGLEYFATQCYDRPDFIRQAMEWVEARNQHAVDRLLSKVQPDFVLYNGDCAYKTGPMIDAKMIRDFCFEPTRRTVEAVGALGIPFAFHSDGKLDDIIPLLLDLGMAAVHGCEEQANDLSHLVERFGDQIALCGNMDVVFLKEATPDQVRQRALRMLEVGAAKGRFIAGCNTSPQDYIPEENYVAFCRAVAGYQP